MDASSRATSFRADGTADSARIRWDEATIAEHDKERGSRRKILEPKTPYRPPSEMSSGASVCSTHSDDMQPDAATEGKLQAALNNSGAWESGSEAGSHGYRDAVDEWDTMPDRSPREPGGGPGGPLSTGSTGAGAGAPQAPELFRSGSWSSVGSRGSGRRRSRDSSVGDGAGSHAGGGGGGGYASDASQSSAGSRSSRRSVSSLSTGGRRRKAGVDLHARFADEAAPVVPGLVGGAANAAAERGPGVAALEQTVEPPPVAGASSGSGAGAALSPPASPPAVKAELRSKRATHYKCEGLLLRQALARAKAAMTDEDEEDTDGDDEGEGRAAAAHKRVHTKDRSSSPDSQGSDMEE